VLECVSSILKCRQSFLCKKLIGGPMRKEDLSPSLVGVCEWSNIVVHKEKTAIPKNFCVLHIQLNTTVFHPAVQ